VELAEKIERWGERSKIIEINYIVSKQMRIPKKKKA